MEALVTPERVPRAEFVRAMGANLAIAAAVLWSAVAGFGSPEPNGASSASLVRQATAMAAAQGLHCTARPQLVDTVLVASGGVVVTMGFDAALAALASGHASTLRFCRS